MSYLDHPYSTTYQIGSRKGFLIKSFDKSPNAYQIGSENTLFQNKNYAWFGIRSPKIVNYANFWVMPDSGFYLLVGFTRYTGQNSTYQGQASDDKQGEIHSFSQEMNFPYAKNPISMS